MTSDLFSVSAHQPLAARMRPKTLDDFFGQDHLIGPYKSLREAVEHKTLHSMILWGPPGVGKTTLAKIIAEIADARFETISAVLAGVKDIREAIAKAQQARNMHNQNTIVFVDEVHRFNKAQQDAFLPYVEDGTILFIGATTENPSFELNNALLSRCRVHVLRKLTPENLEALLRFAISNEERGLGKEKIDIGEREINVIAQAADGDARTALNLLEIATDLAPTNDGHTRITADILREVIGDNVRRFDKGGEYFYDQISALHKSVRGSSPDGALYWFVRMIDGGCDPLYIARRVVRMASEDIGNADPRALEICLNAWQVQERLGSPEGELAIAQAIAYLSVAPKSNAVYSAFNAVKKDIAGMPTYDVPMHLRNAPTNLMKDLGYGKTYRYAHDEPEGYAAGERYLPDEIAEMRWYEPVNRGMEIKIREKLAYLRSLDEKASQ
ncbi:replication-associated recombination protein A [Aurantivibrio plasticivorans]